jgi:uncharacterized protein (TIGR03083 family)
MSDLIAAIQADRTALLEIGRGLTPPQWQAASGCAGWSVQDVVSHLAAEFWAVVDPSKLPDVTGQSLEQAGETQVRSRRHLSAAAALADYEEVSAIGLERLAGLATLDMAVPLADAGTYPAAVLPAAYAFDHLIHIRYDLFAPRGPLDGTPPPADELRVGAALTWIEAGLPQQNTAAADHATLEMVLTGPAARTISFGSGPAKATVTSSTVAFARWVTHRAAWSDLGVEASGDEPALAVARQLRVV